MRQIAEATHICGDPGHAVRHHRQRLAHLPEHGAHQREQPVLGVHVPRRLGVQPGVDQPDEVRARDDGEFDSVGVRGGVPDADHGAGDPGRQLQLSDAGDREEQPRLPSARPRLREPRRAADVARPALRQRRRPRLRGGDHRDHARRGLRAVGARSRAITAGRSPATRRTASRSCASCASTARRSRTSTRPTCRRTCFEAAKAVWDEVIELGEQHGFRNAQATVLAPTGTIGFMMDCDTTGVEPDIALVKYKKLVGGGLMKIVNQTVPMALTRSWATRAQQVKEIIEYIDENETIEGAPHLKDAHLPVFDCAFKPARGVRSIHYMGHIKMMGATQPFLSGAITKTVNVPKEATVEEIEQAYIDSWRIGAKAVSIYRDGSKRTQPLNTSRDKEKAAAAAVEAGPRRRRLPDERARDHPQVRHRRATRATSPSASTRTASRASSSSSWRRKARPSPGFADAFAQAISYALQYGVPLQDLVDKFSHVRFEPSGMTQEPGRPLRQVDRRLHLPVDGGEVPVAGSAVPRRGEQPRGARDDAGAAAARRGGGRRRVADRRDRLAERCRRSRRCRTRKTRRRARPAARSWCAAGPATSARTAARRAAARKRLSAGSAARGSRSIRVQEGGGLSTRAFCFCVDTSGLD